MEPKEQVIHVVFICDENYVMPTIVAVTSIYINKEKSSKYSIHIIASDISSKSHRLFEELNKEDFRVSILDLSQTETYSKYQIKNLHVSTAALHKFNIANLFDQYEKILYLDGDVLIQKDLMNLYNLDISNVYAAVVKDYKPMTYNPPQVEKLGIKHTSYFNSGVMLLNLKKMREDNLSEKLFNYRIKGINYFMDQDALNVVFKEKVQYISFLYNVMSSVMGAFNFNVLKSYYELSEIKNKDDIYKKATIIHLCTRYKPWNYSNVPFAHEWYYYYKNSSCKENLKREEIDISVRKKLFAEIGQEINDTEFLGKKIIVSLTSYPARINFVSQVIESIMKQTIKVDKILLWLAESQFPAKELELPMELTEKIFDSLEICWCDDLKPHKKYYYSMQKFPDDIIITVDDDVYYETDLVETLLSSYRKYPYAVSAMRAHQIMFEEDGHISPYSKWKREYDIVGCPSMGLIATGVGGVLYPPRIMSEELFNKEKIFESCINADDLWLKIMQVMMNTPVVVACKPKKLVNIKNSQKNALWKNNDRNNANDIQLNKILEIYDNFWSEEDSLTKRIRLSSEHITSETINSEMKIKELQQELKEKKRELKGIYDSKSYKLGRMLTFFPRKLRGGIRCYQENGLQYTLNRIKEKSTVFQNK